MNIALSVSEASAKNRGDRGSLWHRPCLQWMYSCNEQLKHIFMNVFLPSLFFLSVYILEKSFVGLINVHKFKKNKRKS